MCLERAPFAEPVRHSEDDLVIVAVRRRCLDGRQVVRVNAVPESIAEDLHLVTPEDRLYRGTDVAAAVFVDDENKVRGRGYEAAEVHRLPTDYGSHNPAQEERGR